ncbi:hypothetical protein ACQ4M3_07775 [Leptolyngbya sp. AN03gr2]|uniref:hypothetical protein n=1 Tax=unclassified Leptolyngbya TaxID=2650499 RepID=UPI003D318C5B
MPDIVNFLERQPSVVLGTYLSRPYAASNSATFYLSRSSDVVRTHCYLECLGRDILPMQQFAALVVKSQCRFAFGTTSCQDLVLRYAVRGF